MLANSNVKFNFIYVSVLILLMALLGIHVHLRPDADDQFFLNMAGDSIFSSLHNRYYNWSGRLSIELILLTTIKHSLFWKLAIPISTLLLCYAIAKMANVDEKTYRALFLTLALGLLIKYDVLKDSVLWVTGYYNYLLPTSLCFFSIWQASIRSESITKMQFSTLFFSFIYSYSEQAAVFSLCFLLIIFTLKDIGNKKFISLLFTITLINFLICYLAPGNKVRAAVEAWFAFPQFLNLSLIQKLSLGISCFYKHATDKQNLLYQLLLLTCAILNIKRRNGIVCYIATSFILLHIFLVYFGERLNLHLYQAQNFDDYFWISYRSFISLAISLIAFLSVILTIIECNDGSDIYIPSVIIICGIITVLAMGLSPTVFESGERIYFIFDCSVLYCLASLMAREIKTNIYLKNNIKKRNREDVVFSFNRNKKKNKIAHDLAVALAAKTCDSSDTDDLLQNYRGHYTKLAKEIDDLNFDDYEELVRPC